MGRDETLSANDVRAMIADGGIIIVYRDSVLKLNSWLDKHPGGKLPILHMVGRDATDEMRALHSAATLLALGAFRIGRKPEGRWPNMTPPIRGGILHDTQAPADEMANFRLDLGYLSSGNSNADNSAASSQLLDVGDDLLGLRPHGARSSTHPPMRSGRRSNSSGADSVEALSKRLASGPTDSARARDSHSWVKRLSPDDYIDWAMKAEIDHDLGEYPSLDPTVQDQITLKYRALHQKIEDLGYYDCPYLEYGKECTRYIALFSAFIGLLRSEWYLLSAVLLGLFWHQLMFTAHDAGHRAITHIFWVDTFIGLFIADFCCGLSIGWWKSSHNVHHLVTNEPEHDPDIQNVPFFATCPSFFKSICSSYYSFSFVWDKIADTLVPYQKYTYYPIMAIARFNLYLLSWLHVLSKRSTGLGSTKAWWIRPTEILFMGGYWFLFGYYLLLKTLPDWATRVEFILISHMVTAPLHVQITLSHWGMSASVLGEGESFAQRQLRTTMDVDCPAYMDFVHGGLQFQVVHHLFPRLPRHNLRQVQVLVREFCQETEIPYSILCFVDGNKKVLGRLGEVSAQLNMLINCQKYMAATAESGLH